VTPLERYFRELLAGERIRNIAAELLRIEDASPGRDRPRIRDAVNHLASAGDRLPALKQAEPETDPVVEGDDEHLSNL
jgi:hypothetical protein